MKPGTRTQVALIAAGSATASAATAPADARISSVAMPGTNVSIDDRSAHPEASRSAAEPDARVFLTLLGRGLRSLQDGDDTVVGIDADDVTGLDLPRCRACAEDGR
jgi:hypothetical protein